MKWVWIALWTVEAFVVWRSTVSILKSRRTIKRLRAEGKKLDTKYNLVARKFTLEQFAIDFPDLEWDECLCKSMSCEYCMGTGVLPIREVYVLGETWKRDISLMELLNNAYH